MKKLFILLSITSLLCNLKSQSTASLDSLSKMYLMRKDTVSAIRTFRKLQFYTNDVDQKKEVNNTLFDLYMQRAQIKDAKFCLDYHQDYLSSDTSSIQRQSMQLFAFFYTGKYWNYAEKVLEVAERNGMSPVDVLFLKFAINYENFDYKKCLQILAYDSFKLKRKEQCALILEKLSRRKRNPRLAARLSIIPGMGQFYSGDVRNGINSILLNGGFIYGAYWLSAHTHPIASVPLVLFGLRYYKGGIQNSKIYSTKRNIKNRERFRNALFSEFTSDK